MKNKNLRRNGGSKRVIKEKRGQFVVAAALLISILTLSVALSVHRLSLHRLQLRYEPVEELVMGLSSDLDRCLTFALHNATELYYNLTSEYGLSIEEARSESLKEVYRFVSKWASSVIKSYSTLGLSIVMKKNQTVPIDFQINWGNHIGTSSISTNLFIDIESYGFRGWVGHSGKYVMLNLTDHIWFSESMESTSLIFKIIQGKDEDTPIPNLTKESIKVWVNSKKNQTIETNILDLKYLGMGFYNITFSPSMNNNTKGLYLLVKTPQDHIYVAASIPYQDIVVTLRSQEASSQEFTDRGRIKLGDKDPYKLPINLSSVFNNSNLYIDVGEYGLSYIPENENYGFYNWTATGEIIIENNLENNTRVVIRGNGTIIAFYIPYMTVNFSSCEDDGSTMNRGWIVFNGDYLRNQTGDPGLPSFAKVAEGSYNVGYIPESGYTFINWTCSGDVSVYDPYSRETKINVRGNGSITAYYNKTETPTLTVNFYSCEDDGSTKDLGSIVFPGADPGLPSFAKVAEGSYNVGYIPESGYTFINWTCSGDVSVGDPYSRETKINVRGNGSITAYYQAFRIYLNSRDLNRTSENLGSITLGDNNYSLYWVLKISPQFPPGLYMVRYNPENSTYKFYRWESTGGVISSDSQNIETNITVTGKGDGNLTAIYYIPSNPPPMEGDWSTLYVDKGAYLYPISMRTGFSSHIPSWASTGKDKQEIVLKSPTTPPIPLDPYINITLYLRPNPPQSAKSMDIELGFYDNNGTYHLIGSNMSITINGENIYNITLVGQVDSIPEGSIIVMKITMTFYVPPGGTFFLYYGPKSPSCVKLFIPQNNST